MSVELQCYVIANTPSLCQLVDTSAALLGNDLLQQLVDTGRSCFEL